MAVLNRSTALLIALLVGATLAGCIADEPVTPPTQEEGPAHVPEAPDHDFSTAITDLHDHENPLLHEGGFGLEQVAWNDLTDGALTDGTMTGQYNEVSVCGTLATVASFAGNRGFTLVDLEDPSDPKVLSHFPTASTNWDVRLSDDCTTVFVGMELGQHSMQLPVDHLGLSDAGAGGILVVDVSDPTNPVRESYNPVGSTHNVWTMDIDNQTYVFNEHVKIMELVGERGSRTLEVVAEIPGTHDVSSAFHPTTGVPYMFTGTDGLSVVDISDPAEPEVVGTIEELPAGSTLWHEQSPAPALIDGRWIMVGAGESTPGQAQPYSIVDITDPTTPAVLSTWMVPGAPFQTRGFYTFSPHNVDIRSDGRVALANYHAGIWVIDLSTQERQEAPVTLGYALPNEVGPTVVHSLPYSPYVWGGMWLDSGELVTADLNSGLYVYQVE